MHDLQFGLDSELIIANHNGTLWPHHVGIPQERTDLTKQFDWHGDGFAWELCVAPSDKPEGVCANVAKGLRSLYLDFNVRKAMGPSMYIIPLKVVREAPKEIQRLGCMPSFNVYNNQAQPKGLGTTRRTTGCHFHVSSSAINKETYANVIKWADILVGSVWTSLSPEPIVDERQRRRYYGKAGEYRVRFYDAAKSRFGVEYRTLPGSVLHHPAYLHIMLECMQYATEYALNSGMPPQALSEEAVRVINMADRNNRLFDRVDVPASLRESLEYARHTRARTLDINAWKGIV